MKKFIAVSAIVMGILLLIAIVRAALVFSAFSGNRQYVPEPVYSADRSRVIVPTINYDKMDAAAYLCVHLEVRDARTGVALYQVQTHASDRIKWSVRWIDDTMFQLDSSDIGLYCWQENAGNWKEIACP